MKQKKTVFMAEIAILAALILIMAFTPIGYLRIGALSLTLLMIPVSVGAVVMGPLAGAGLGCLFGLTSFAQCFMGDVLGSILAAKNIFFTFVVCVVSRTLAGLLCGVVYRLFRKKAARFPYWFPICWAPCSILPCSWASWHFSFGISASILNRLRLWAA